MPLPSSIRSGAGAPTACPGSSPSCTATGAWATTSPRSTLRAAPCAARCMTNVLYGLSRLALGEPSLTPTIIERMYDEASGLFWPARPPGTAALHPADLGRALAAGPPGPPGGDRAPSGRAATCLTQLGSGCRCRCPRCQPMSARSRYATPRLASTATGADRAGSTPPGFCGSGFGASATRRRPASSAGGLSAATLASGLREYYDPYTGRGMGAPSFAWSALAVELADPDPAAAVSYLGP